MKKTWFMLLSAAVSLTVSAQKKISAAKVPADVRSAFAKVHPNVKASWEKEDANYEVNFKENGKTMSVLINDKGTIIETETDIAMSELPAAASSYLATHYKGAKVKEAAKIWKDGKWMYEAEIKGKDVMFDANGKFLKEIKE